MKQETPPKTAEEKATDFLYNSYQRLNSEVGNVKGPLYSSAEVIWLLKEYASQFASTPTSKQEGEAEGLKKDKEWLQQQLGEANKTILNQLARIKEFDEVQRLNYETKINELEEKLLSATQQEGRREEAVSPMSTRLSAMKWWNELTYPDKTLQAMKYERIPESLTGREIEALFAASIPPNIPLAFERCVHCDKPEQCAERRRCLYTIPPNKGKEADPKPQYGYNFYCSQHEALGSSMYHCSKQCDECKKE